MDRSGLSTLNEIVVNQSAVAAWQAANGGALQEVLEDFDSRTRGSASNLKKATSQRCLPAQNMARAWNASEALRRAETLAEARTVAKKMAKEARHSWEAMWKKSSYIFWKVEKSGEQLKDTATTEYIVMIDNRLSCDLVAI